MSLYLAARFAQIGALLLPLILSRLGIFTYSDVFFLLSFILWMLNLKHYPNFFKRYTRLLAFCTLLELYFLLISSYSSIDPFQSKLGSLKLFFSIAILGPVVFFNIRILGDVKSLVISFATGGALASISAIISPADRVSGVFTRNAGLAGHPVGLAITCGTCIALLSTLKFKSLIKYYVALLVSVNCVGIVTSIGLTGAALAVIGVLSGQIYKNTNLIWKTLKLFGLGSILTILLMSSSFTTLRVRLWGALNPTSGVSNTASGLQGSTIDIRILTIKYGYQRALEHPLFGNGFDMAGQLSLGDIQTHNYWILMFQTGGLVAAAIALYIGILCIYYLFYNYRYRAFNSFANLSSVAIITTFCGGMTSPALYDRMYYFTLALGLGTALNREENE